MVSKRRKTDRHIRAKAKAERQLTKAERQLERLKQVKAVLVLAEELLKLAPCLPPERDQPDLDETKQTLQLYEQCQSAVSTNTDWIRHNLNRLQRFLVTLPFSNTPEEFLLQSSYRLWLVYCFEVHRGNIPDVRSEQTIKQQFDDFTCCLWMNYCWIRQGRLFRTTALLGNTFSAADIPVEASCLRLPFCSMLIETPSRLSSERNPLTAVLVSRYTERDTEVLCLLRFGRVGSNPTLGRFVLGTHDTIQQDLEPLDETLRRLVTFVCNVILYCASFPADVQPNNQQRVEKLEQRLQQQQGNKRKKTQRRLQQTKSETIYIVGTAFRLADRRAADELNREGKRLTRHIVRGHWRNQACGLQYQERKLIFVQPHWRGVGAEGPDKTYVLTTSTNDTTE